MTIFDAATHLWPALVPELLVTDISNSVLFWRDMLGFTVLYDRPEQRFAYLARERAEVMLEECRDESWLAQGLARPYGQGINLQIGTSSLAPILGALARANHPLFSAPQERWYRTGQAESGQRQFLVQDPDGYLLRFIEELGSRPVP
jgi:catechol 2,3-dioxygenase-like lactoylglutathione lyase family enzyme